MRCAASLCVLRVGANVGPDRADADQTKQHHTPHTRTYHARKVACGDRDDGRCDVPALPPGVTYTQVVAGGHHTVLLRSDGRAVACGSNDCGQSSVPMLQPGATYCANGVVR